MDVVMVALAANAIVKKCWIVLKSESLGYDTKPSNNDLDIQI